MDGNTLLALFNNFVDSISKSNDILLLRYIYEGSIFGNYDVTFRFKKTDIVFNCDRNHLSVMVTTGKNQSHDYFKLLSKMLNVQQYDCNAMPEDIRLAEALRLVSDTISELLIALKQK